ncbi:hypothetical protein ADUPG1_007709 [Aduncisulcus paluster]|uniref:B box-type domain-containing protein n=1 Tax=Aduncisulcus paluster TaxID=2918883 RepID=A0ABQ5KQQ8_9EUKA|nr:hypothetical protein ADUPG1_007709 [Aduncisulcus paluster]
MARSELSYYYFDGNPSINPSNPFCHCDSSSEYCYDCDRAVCEECSCVSHPDFFDSSQYISKYGQESKKIFLSITKRKIMRKKRKIKKKTSLSEDSIDFSSFHHSHGCKRVSPSISPQSQIKVDISFVFTYISSFVECLTTETLQLMMHRGILCLCCRDGDRKKEITSLEKLFNICSLRYEKCRKNVPRYLVDEDSDEIEPEMEGKRVNLLQNDPIFLFCYRSFHCFCHISILPLPSCYPSLQSASITKKGTNIDGKTTSFGLIVPFPTVSTVKIPTKTRFRYVWIIEWQQKRSIVMKERDMKRFIKHSNLNEFSWCKSLY